MLNHAREQESREISEHQPCAKSRQSTFVNIPSSLTTSFHVQYHIPFRGLEIKVLLVGGGMELRGGAGVTTAPEPQQALARQTGSVTMTPTSHSPHENHTDLWFLKIIIQSKNKKWVLILQQRTTASYTHHTCTGCPVRFRPCCPAHQVVCRGPSTLRPRVWASDMMQTSPGNCKDTDTVLEASFVTHGNGFPNLLILFITIITIW